MKRLLSWTLLLLFGLLPAAPLFASNAGEASLPACCRRNGKHHCMMKMADLAALSGAGRSFGGVPERCPCLPRSTAPVTSQLLDCPAAAAHAVFFNAHPNSPQQTEARYRLSFSRSRQKRGPPSGLL